jgi:hypothetical protein
MTHRQIILALIILVALTLLMIAGVDAQAAWG